SIFGWLKNTSGYSITYIPQRAELDSSVSPADLYELGDRAPTTGLVDVNGDDVAAVMGTTEDGALINVMSGWSVHHPAGVTWEAYGSDGTLALSESGELLYARPGKELSPLEIPKEYGITGNPDFLQSSGLGLKESVYMPAMFQALAEDVGRTVAGEKTD